MVLTFKGGLLTLLFCTLLACSVPLAAPAPAYLMSDVRNA